MAQKLIQTQTQKLAQQQRLSQQQMLNIKLLEMPVTELEENVNAELDDNPALERDDEGHDDNLAAEPADNDTPADSDENFEQKTEREDREEALDSALQDIGRDDQMPETYSGQPTDNADYEEMVYGDTTSFYDKLKEQMDMEELSPKEHDIMEYLIGSLDSDGLLRKDIGAIADELAIYHNIDASEKEVESALKRLQTFDPPGIGARSLQECLLLQIDRKPEGRLRDLMHSVIADHYEDFIKKHWDKIKDDLRLNDLQADTLREEIVKLNPKPGAAMGETEGRSLQQVTPDFIVDTDDGGNVTFTINYGNIPQLKVSESFNDMVDTYRNNRQHMNRREKEALLYARQKVERANSYIEAIKQRRHTLYVTMKAIIERQHKFFVDGDEADLQPMILKDIAEMTGLDISTISRVSNEKYAQTRWGTFPLRFFFSDGYTTNDGEELSTRKIKLALKDIIDHEDSSHPQSDDALTKEMKKKGFPIARRTIAKYREQMGIPVARLRKK